MEPLDKAVAEQLTPAYKRKAINLSWDQIMGATDSPEDLVSDRIIWTLEQYGKKMEKIKKTH